MPTLERLGVGALRDTMTSFRDAVRAHAAAINRLNVYPVPDGDTGTNMARTLDAVVEALDGVRPDMHETCQAISRGSLMGARGNSGVILSQILRGMAGVLDRAGDATGPTLAEAFRAAATAAYAAVLKPVEGTILTVVRAAAEAAEEAARLGGSVVGVLDAARTAGREALARTPEQLPVLRDAGVVDAGGAGFVLLLDAALHVVDGRPVPEPDETSGLEAPLAQEFGHRGDVSDLRYEVMYFLDLPDERIDAFKHDWGEIGDSIVVVGGEGLWNCHVHTDDIGAAIECALGQGGRPHQIRVTDLFAEEATVQAAREAEIQRGRPSSLLPPVTTAVVAVAVGDGLVELFGQLGVQGVVSGGQTMNPSTAELLSAVEAVNADQVVVLPNNRNIIPVAEQVHAFTPKLVRVVPTRSMPEALAALVAYDPEADVDTNTAAMVSALDGVATGEITQAVRDASSLAGPVHAGDWIGLAGRQGIVSAGPELAGAVEGLLARLMYEGAGLLTVIEGEGAEVATTEAVRRWVAEHRPDIEVEVHRGDQPLYPYLFGVE
jgi:DAK2 domain fusion protein YloV